MKKLILFILLLSATVSFAQNFEKDTIQLKEVFIGSTPPKNARTVKTKFSGLCSFFGNVIYGYDRINLVTDLPEGYIKSVEFNFNRKIGKQERDLEFSETDLQLVFFEVTPSGKPGNIIGQPITFTVKVDYKGKMEIPVPYPMVKNPGKIFVGLRRVKPLEPNYKTDLRVNCMCDGEVFTSYQYNPVTERWVKLDYASAVYKMTIKEIVLPAK